MRGVGNSGTFSERKLGSVPDESSCLPDREGALGCVPEAVRMAQLMAFRRLASTPLSCARICQLKADRHELGLGPEHSRDSGGFNLTPIVIIVSLWEA
jgi:hypothetical protein